VHNLEMPRSQFTTHQPLRYPGHAYPARPTLAIVT
jgi:hypothetical protein